MTSASVCQPQCSIIADSSSLATQPLVRRPILRQLHSRCSCGPASSTRLVSELCRQQLSRRAQRKHHLTCTNGSGPGVLQDHAGARPANLLPGQKAARLRQLLAGDTCVQVLRPKHRHWHRQRHQGSSRLDDPPRTEHVVTVQRAHVTDLHCSAAGILNRCRLHTQTGPGCCMCRRRRAMTVSARGWWRKQVHT
jgi:hypothetical protein